MPTRKANPYSRPQDAYATLFSSIPNPTYSTRPPPPAAPSPATAGPTLMQRATTKPRRAQPQKLTETEAEAFADLMSTFLPRSPTTIEGESRNFDIPGLETIQTALRRKVISRETNYRRKHQMELDRGQENEFDRMKEIMHSLKTDRDLLEWSFREIFGFEFNGLFVNPSAIFKRTDLTKSAIYPSLLLELFVLLRDTHRSPHSALHIFHLASQTPTSYVLGCTTALYNEVLRTRWMEGDVESVALGIAEMRSGGIRIDDGTRLIVAAVGEAMQNDTAQAESQAQKFLDIEKSGGKKVENSQGSWPTFDESTSLASSSALDLSDNLLDSFRFFSSAQLDAWGRMERIIEEDLDAARSQKAALEEEEMMKWELGLNEKANSYRREVGERMDGWNAEDYPSRRREGEWNDAREGEHDGRDRYGPTARTRIGRDNSDAVQLEPVEADEDAADFSYQNFPKFELATEEEKEKRIAEAEEGRKNLLINFEKMRALELGPRDTQRAPSGYSSSAFARNRAEREEEWMREKEQKRQQMAARDLEERQYSEGMSLPNERAMPMESFDPPTASNGYDSFFESRIESATPAPRVPKIDKYARDNEGHFGGGIGELPKRPSSLNPFKIRKKGLTKEEKARYDTPHPMLAWKNK